MRAGVADKVFSVRMSPVSVHILVSVHRLFTFPVRVHISCSCSNFLILFSPNSPSPYQHPAHYYKFLLSPHHLLPDEVRRTAIAAMTAMVENMNFIQGAELHDCMNGLLKSFEGYLKLFYENSTLIHYHPHQRPSNITGPITLTLTLKSRLRMLASGCPVHWRTHGQYAAGCNLARDQGKASLP